MDFFENIDALLWKLCILGGILLIAAGICRLLLRGRSLPSSSRQRLQVRQGLKGSGLKTGKTPDGDRKSVV